MPTIATHNGSKAHRDHNLRGHSTDKQEHIQKGGIHETWKDEAPRAAYDRIFGEAVAAYNAKQSRPERQIKDYYNKIAQDEKKHPVYEMIVGVYGGIPEDACKSILSDFVNDWEKRNPNLELIGAYYHADEEGEPHVHLDYIPVARGYTRGMEVQNGLVKALGQQGFEKQGKATAQILWEQRENQALEQICMEYGIEIEHPQKNKGVEHLHTEAYKVQQELQNVHQELQNGIMQASMEKSTLEDKIIALEGEFEAEKGMYDGQIKAKEEELASLTGAVMEQEELKERTVDKTILGKSKDTVTMPYQEYQALHHYANLQDNVKQRERQVAVKEAWCQAKERELTNQQTSLEQLESELNDRIENAPKYKDDAARYSEWYHEASAKADRLENELDTVKKENVMLEARQFDMERSVKQMEQTIKEQEKELSLFQQVYGKIKDWVLEKLHFLKQAEEVLQEPDGKTSKLNKMKDDQGYESGPYARYFHADKKWQFFWEQDGKMTNSDRKGFLRRGYLPAAAELQQELGHTKMLNQDILQEAVEVQQSYGRQHTYSREHGGMSM